MQTTSIYLYLFMIIIYGQNINLNSHCSNGRIDGCEYDLPYLSLYKNDNKDPMTKQEAQQLCQNIYNTNLASIDLSITNIISISDQFTIMRDLCDSSGPNIPCWISAIRNINNTNQFIFDELIISSNRDDNYEIYNEYFFGINEGNGNNEDIVFSLFSSYYH